MLLRCRIPLAHFELDIDVTFDARVTSIFGPSGSGKTTLARRHRRFETASQREIEVNGQNAVLRRPVESIAHPENRGIGYVSSRGRAVSASFGAKEYPIRSRTVRHARAAV